jgi:hypothetical protein
MTCITFILQRKRDMRTHIFSVVIAQDNIHLVELCKHMSISVTVNKNPSLYSSVKLQQRRELKNKTSQQHHHQAQFYTVVCVIRTFSVLQTLRGTVTMFTREQIWLHSNVKHAHLAIILKGA